MLITDRKQTLCGDDKMFTKELNKLAHKIKKAHSLTWGEALKLAIALPEENLMASTSLLGDWTYETARAVAPDVNRGCDRPRNRKVNGRN